MEKNCSRPEPPDPRVRRTRKLLADALRALMRERPFSSISVLEITERAMVNRATFYAHYPSKEALAVAILQDDLHQTMVGQFSQCPTFSAADLRTIAMGVFSFIATMHTHCPTESQDLQAVAGPALQNGLYELMDGWLARNLTYKQHFPGSSRETLASALAWSLYGAALRWSASSPRPPVEEVCREIVSVFFPDSGII